MLQLGLVLGLVLAQSFTQVRAQETPGSSAAGILVAPFDNFTSQHALLPRPDNPRLKFDRYAETVREAVERRLVGARLPVVDRGRLEAVLQEEQFAATGLVDGRSATAVGLKLGGRWLVTGNLGAQREMKSKRIVTVGKRVRPSDVFEAEVVVTVKVIELATLRVRYVGRYPGSARFEEQRLNDDLAAALEGALTKMAADAGLVAILRAAPGASATLQTVVLPFANAAGGRGAFVRSAATPGLAIDRIAETARDAVEGELVRRAIAIVDRRRIQDALAEMELGTSGMVDETTSARVGKFLGARYVVTGSVHSFQNAESKKKVDRRTVAVDDLSVKVLVKVFDVETTQIVHIEEFAGDLRWEGIQSHHGLEAVLERALAKLCTNETLADACRVGN